MTALFLFLSLTAHAEIFETLPVVVIDGEPQKYTAVLRVSKDAMRAYVFNDGCAQINETAGAIQCAKSPDLVALLEVPLAEHGDNCGSDIYKGAESGVTMQVADHKGRRCRDYKRYPLEVNATAFNAVTRKTTRFYLAK